MRLAKDFAIFLFFGPFRIFVQSLKAETMYDLSKLLGLLIYYFIPSKRRELINEIQFVFKYDSTETEVRSYTKKALGHLMACELERLCYPILSCNNIRQYTSCAGLENVDEGLERKKGVILLFSHFGANQMIMPAMGYRGYAMSQLSAPATVWKDKMVGRKFSKAELWAMEKRWEHEKSLPVEHINIFGFLKKAFECLKRNELLGVAIDGAGGANMEEFDFLNRKAVFATGPLQIAIKTDCVVLPTFVVRGKDGINQIIIENELIFNRNKDQKEAIHELTQLYISRLEKYVFDYPDQYSNFLALRRLMAKKGDAPFFLNN